MFHQEPDRSHEWVWKSLESLNLAHNSLIVLKRSIMFWLETSPEEYLIKIASKMSGSVLEKPRRVPEKFSGVSMKSWRRLNKCKNLKYVWVSKNLKSVQKSKGAITGGLKGGRAPTELWWAFLTNDEVLILKLSYFLFLFFLLIDRHMLWAPTHNISSLRPRRRVLSRQRFKMKVLVGKPQKIPKITKKSSDLK